MYRKGGLTPPPEAPVPIPNYKGPPPPRPARPDALANGPALFFLTQTDLRLKDYDREALVLEQLASTFQSQGKLFARDVDDVRDNIRLVRNTLQTLRTNPRITGDNYDRAMMDFDKVVTSGLLRTVNLIRVYQSQLCLPERQKYCESYSSVFSAGKCPSPCELVEDTGRFQKFVRGKRCVYPEKLASAAPAYDRSLAGSLSKCPAMSYDKI